MAWRARTGPEENSQIVAIHAALFPTGTDGEILFFEGFFGDGAGRSFIYDCRSTMLTDVTYVPQGTEAEGKNLFCAGHAQLGDGTLLIAGGHAANVQQGHEHGHGGSGIRECFVYKPRERRWKAVRKMWPQPNSGAQTSDDDGRGGGRWYPTLVTLGNGEVLAVGGHPLAGPLDMADNYPKQVGAPEPDFPPPEDPSRPRRVDWGRRHSNNTPERYRPGSNTWTLMRNKETAAIDVLDEYDRLHLVPSGHVFFATLAKRHNDCRLIDPYTGDFAGNGYGRHIDSRYDDANCAARTTTVVLPILHGDPAFWILAAGAAAPERINLSDGSPTWVPAGNRDPWPDTSLPLRDHLLGIILPTGQVFFSHGMRPVAEGAAADPVFEPEVYTPGIDWSNGTYTGSEGTWQTLDAEPSDVPRGYHSVALLQSDGTVWTAGSTHAGTDVANPDDATRELRIHVYEPAYGGSRPQIDFAPQSATWSESFTVRMSNNASVHRVALIRCGSFTHAFDNDQRYITLNFTQSGSTLTVQAPQSSNIAPPGTYMLWVLRNEVTPCQRARFIRIAPQDRYFALGLSTYSLLAVKALRPPYTEDSEARFADAITLFYEGFLPHELEVPGQTPTLSWGFSGGGNVPGMRIELARRGQQIDPVANPDTAQKFSFVYDVIFENEQAFDTFDDDDSRIVVLRAEINDYVDVVNLTLMKKANPFMKDGDPPWLSRDLRIHKATVGEVTAAGGPEAYIDGVLTAFETAGVPHDSENHPFRLLDASQDENPVVLEVPLDDDGIYNFAIARVRFLSIPDEDAEDVRVFFRLFNTVGTALEYDPHQTYRTLDGPDGPIAGLGRQGSVLTSIPFFANDRVTPENAMTMQSDDDVNKRTLPGQGPDMTVRYFGCWLDVNMLAPHFPSTVFDDGPFDDGSPFSLLPTGSARSILSLIAGYHQCLVAEISYADDPTSVNQTPFTSDNLAQRNLATVPVANPGLKEITRTAQTSIEVKASDAPTGVLLNPATNPVGTASARLRADELLFWSDDLPPGSKVEIYLPDVDIDEVLALAAKWIGPAVLERLDENTLVFELGEVTYLPLPGSRETPIVGLMSVTLPSGIVKGQSYSMSVLQYSGSTRRLVGAFEFAIPVEDTASLLPGEIRKLSLLRWIFEQMHTSDRWYPVFVRYLYEIAERVRGFGGDPDSVWPSPHGDGRPYGDDRPDDDDPGDNPEDGLDDCHDDHHDAPAADTHSGRICRIQYDCFGDFTGFVLTDCEGGDRMFCGNKGLEKVALIACREAARVTVHTSAAPGCCGSGDHDHELQHTGTINATCPWSGKPVSRDGVTKWKGKTVGFCSSRHREEFDAAVARLRLRRPQPLPLPSYVPDVAPVNTICPASGKPVSRDLVVKIKGGAVGFCCGSHRDRFKKAVIYFRECARFPPTRSTHHGGAGGETVNQQCPWSEKPVNKRATMMFEGVSVGFCSVEHRDWFQRAVDAGTGDMPTGHHHTGAHGTHGRAHETCPFSGKPASDDHVVEMDGGAVRFCSMAHRERFERAVRHFEKCADDKREKRKPDLRPCQKVLRIELSC